MRDFFNLVLLLSLSPINAFQKQETGRAISASQTRIKSNGISLEASEIVRQTVATCEGVRKTGDWRCNNDDCVCVCTVREMERKREKT